MHAVDELAMVIIGRSVMLRSGLGAGTGEISGKLLALDETKIEEIHDIIKRQTVSRKGGVERARHPQKNWAEMSMASKPYEKATNDLMSSIIINLRDYNYR